MSNPDEAATHNGDAGPSATAFTPPAYVENPTPALGFGVSSITRRWKREDLFNKGSLIARGFAFLLSLLSFIITASNKHGDWGNFDNYEEYRSYQNSIHIKFDPKKKSSKFDYEIVIFTGIC